MAFFWRAVSSKAQDGIAQATAQAFCTSEIIQDKIKFGKQEHKKKLSYSSD